LSAASSTAPLPRALAHAAAGAWPAAESRGSVTLPFAERHRRRLRLTLDQGGALLLDLPRAVALAPGDGLALEGGGWIEVRAAIEELAEIRAEDPLLFVRVAWHLGNRHLPTQVFADRLVIRPDHVIEAMVRGLGAEVRAIRAPFQPEGGAYGGSAGGHHHGHGHDDHGHDHDHDHDREHQHGHHHAGARNHG